MLRRNIVCLCNEVRVISNMWAWHPSSYSHWTFFALDNFTVVSKSRFQSDCWWSGQWYTKKAQPALFTGFMWKFPLCVTVKRKQKGMFLHFSTWFIIHHSSYSINSPEYWPAGDFDGQHLLWMNSSASKICFALSCCTSRLPLECTRHF